MCIMSSSKLSPLNPLILKIYEAALEPTLWQEITLEISDLMNSGATQLLVLDQTTKAPVIAASTRLSQAGQKQYVEDYAPIDLRVPNLMNCNIGETILEHMILNEDEQKNNFEVSNFLEKYELENLTGSNLSIDSNWVWFGTARKGEGNIFAADELEKFHLLIPHIRKSLRLHLSMETIKTQTSSLADLWNYAGKGIVLFNGSGAVCFTNDLAEKLVAQNLICLHQQRLCFNDAQVNKRFQAALRDVLGKPSIWRERVQDSFLVTDEGGRDYGVRLVRHLGELHEMNNVAGVRAILLITALHDARNYSSKEIDCFGDLFGLTEAEKRVVKAVADLENLTEFALQIGLKPDSIRKQLKSAMAKTGVASQKELIRRLERFCFIQMA